MSDKNDILERLDAYTTGDEYDALCAASARLIRAQAREIEYLRHYGNKACTHMADEAMVVGELDDNGEPDDG